MSSEDEKPKLRPGCTELSMDEEVTVRVRRDPNVRTHEEIVPGKASNCVMTRLSQLRAGREAAEDLAPMKEGAGWGSGVETP